MTTIPHKTDVSLTFMRTPPVSSDPSSALGSSQLADLRDSHLGTDIHEHALRTERIYRAADVLSPGDQVQVDDRPPPPRRRAVERLLRFLRRPRVHPAHAVRDAMDVGVDADVLLAAVGEDQHEVRGLASDAREREQLLHVRRHPSAEARRNLPARLPDVDGLVPVETHGIDQLPNLGERELRHRVRRPRHAKQPRRRGGRHRISRLRRQHRWNEDLKRIFLLIFGDLLAGRFVQPVDGLRQPTHHDGNRRFSQGTGVSGGLPPSTASTFRAARSAIAVRVSRVALPRCGTSRTFSNPSSPGLTWGSFSKTSSAAPAISRSVSAHTSASSSTTDPRAVLTRNAERFIRASALRLIKCRVSGPPGVWIEITSEVTSS